VVSLRSVIRFFALFLLTFAGSVEGARMVVAPALQACACGCGAPSEAFCGCKAPAEPSTPSQSPRPCSEPSGGCTVNTTPTSSITATKEAEDPTKDPDPKPEPHPWPHQAEWTAIQGAASLLRLGFGAWARSAPPWPCLQRLAWLSTFRN
jgi:hypothetical protein